MGDELGELGQVELAFAADDVRLAVAGAGCLREKGGDNGVQQGGLLRRGEVGQGGLEEVGAKMVTRFRQHPVRALAVGPGGGFADGFGRGEDEGEGGGGWGEDGLQRGVGEVGGEVNAGIKRMSHKSRKEGRQWAVVVDGAQIP